MRLLLDRFREAWDRRDVESAVACFAEDGAYHASICSTGEHGRANGRDEIKKLIQQMFAHDDGAISSMEDISIVPPPDFDGPWLVWWNWVYRLPDARVERGCDRIKILDDEIILKDAYRKIVGRMC